MWPNRRPYDIELALWFVCMAIGGRLGEWAGTRAMMYLLWEADPDRPSADEA